MNCSICGKAAGDIGTCMKCQICGEVICKDCFDEAFNCCKNCLLISNVKILISSLSDIGNYVFPEQEIQIKAICECGAEKCNLHNHSEWCPKYKENKI